MAPRSLPPPPSNPLHSWNGSEFRAVPCRLSKLNQQTPPPADPSSIVRLPCSSPPFRGSPPPAGSSSSSSSSSRPLAAAPPAGVRRVSRRQGPHGQRARRNSNRASGVAFCAVLWNTLPPAARKLQAASRSAIPPSFLLPPALIPILLSRRQKRLGS